MLSIYEYYNYHRFNMSMFWTHSSVSVVNHFVPPHVRNKGIFLINELHFFKLHEIGKVQTDLTMLNKLQLKQ